MAGSRADFLFLHIVARWQAKRKQNISAFGQKMPDSWGSGKKRKQGVVVLLLVTRCQVVGKTGFFMITTRRWRAKTEGEISSAFGHQMAGRKESRYSLQEISDLQRIIYINVKLRVKMKKKISADAKTSKGLVCSTPHYFKRCVLFFNKCTSSFSNMSATHV
jgi:hypothetical protein